MTLSWMKTASRQIISCTSIRILRRARSRRSANRGCRYAGGVDPDHDVTLRKPFRDAFAGTDLDERLKRREIDTLLISGLYRHYSYNLKQAQCVGQTMKAAVDLGYNTFVVEDLTVGHAGEAENTTLALARMALGEGAHSVTADHVRRVVAKYQP
jgi:nicotinamidase-related amidase